MLDVDALARLQEASLARAAGGLRASWPPETAMDAAELGAFLAGHGYCVLATTTSRGRPVARPVSFAVAGAVFCFATVAGPRLDNVTRTPWASVVVSEGDAGGHRAVAADGPVRIFADPPEELVADWVAKFHSRPEWAAAWVELRPTRLVSYSAEKARG